MNPTTVNHGGEPRFWAVTGDDAEAWDRMLAAARKRDLWIQPASIAHIVSRGMRAFHVESFSARDPLAREPHFVLIWTDGEITRVSCDCEYGTYRNRPCSHAALALWEADAFPFDLDRPQQTELAVAQIRCPYCDVACRNQDDYREHYTAAHHWPCRYCGVIYDSADALTVHVSLTHNRRQARAVQHVDPASAARVLAKAGTR